MNRITGNPVEINDLFNNRYTVQYYQREYNWGTKQIEELVYDLTNEFLNYYYACENRDEINIEKFYPCLSASHECMFDCEKFAECALNGTWSPE